MFDSLSNALVSKGKKAKTCDVTETTQDQDKENPDIKDVINNLPTFDIQPMDDFDTIDDNLLGDLIYETSTQDAQPKATGDKNLPTTVSLQEVPQNINQNVQQNQVQNKFTFKNQNFPVPPMYFPHSNVTINYNFGNK